MDLVLKSAGACLDSAGRSLLLSFILDESVRFLIGLLLLEISVVFKFKASSLNLDCTTFFVRLPAVLAS